MEEISEYERRVRRENAIFGTVLLIAIVVMSVLIGMIGAPVQLKLIPPL